MKNGIPMMTVLSTQNCQDSGQQPVNPTSDSSCDGKKPLMQRPASSALDHVTERPCISAETDRPVLPPIALTRRRSEMTSRPCIQVLREIVLGEPSKSRKAALFMYFITFVIIISILSTCTQTIRSVRSEPTARSVFLVVNIFTSVIFTIELLLRFIVALTPDQATTSSVIRAARGLLADPLTWIDVVALLPFYIGITDGELRDQEPPALEALRLLRLLRMFTLARHFTGAIVLWTALKRSAPVLIVPLYFLITSVGILSGIFYVVEYLLGGNGDFENVYVSGYFVLVTMTTVGYGDMSPITNGGKAIVSVTMVLGVLFMAMPITIVGSAFADAWEEKEEILSSQNQRATMRSRVESCERLSVPDIARGPSKLQSLGRSSSFLHRPAHTRMSMGGAAFRAAMPNLSEDAEGISRRASDAREANIPPEVSARLASLEAAVKEVQATSQLLQQALLRIEGKLEASSPNSADA